jgi:Fe-S cluster biogenesis protein NfuA
MQRDATGPKGDARDGNAAIYRSNVRVTPHVGRGRFAAVSELDTVIDEVIRPLIEADGGTIESVDTSATEIVIRLGGACAGCPGFPLTRGQVIEPLVQKALGRAIKVVVEAR